MLKDDSSRLADGWTPGLGCAVLLCLRVARFPLCCLFIGWWLSGCASDEPSAPEPDQRPRIDQILSPQGSKPNDAYTKRSRYDGQDFKSATVGQRSFGGTGSGKKAREGGERFHSEAGGRARWSGQQSRFASTAANEGGKSARTFSSRFGKQEARTQEFSGAREKFRASGEAREAQSAFHTGEARQYSTRTLGATQLSPSARETATLFSADAAAPLNEEEVRRVLNKSPRER